MNFKKIIGLAFIVVAITANAQDIHFSQYNQAPLELNPALTGLSNCDYRVGVNARTQWNTVSEKNNTYATFGAFGDAAIGKVTKFNSFAGLGLSLSTDFAGALGLNTTKASLNFAYHIMLDKKGRNSISAGLQFAVNYRGLNPNKATFDNQYDPNNSVYDPTKAGETFSRNSMIFLDAGLGLLYNGNFGRGSNFFLGLGITHVNQPGISFYKSGIFNMKAPTNSSAEKLFMKFTAHGGGSFLLKDNLWLNPTFMLLFQGNSKQLNIGTLVKMKIGNERLSKSYLYLGLHVRALYADAVIPHIRYEYKGFGVGFSFDVNTSKLYASSLAFGGPELSFIYTGCGKGKPKPFFCPEL